MSPLATSGNPGLSFAVTAPFTANAGEVLEILIGFEASTAAGFSMQGNSLELVGQTAVLPDGAITVVEDKCLGGVFATPPTDCSGTSAGLAVFDVGLDSAVQTDRVLACCRARSDCRPRARRRHGGDRPCCLPRVVRDVAFRHRRAGVPRRLWQARSPLAYSRWDSLLCVAALYGRLG